MKDGEIRAISGRDGWYIDQIKVQSADGSEEQTSPSFGGNGGGPWSWEVPAGEHIQKLIYAVHDGMIISMIFETDKGNKSPSFGAKGNGPKGVTAEYTLPTGARLDGVFGHNDAYVRGLGFYYN